MGLRGRTRELLGEVRPDTTTRAAVFDWIRGDINSSLRQGVCGFRFRHLQQALPGYTVPAFRLLLADNVDKPTSIESSGRLILQMAWV